jgi:hypothetical protein
MRKLIVGAVLGLLAFAPVAPAHAGWLARNKGICDIYMGTPTPPDISTISNCFAHDDGIDLTLIDNRIGGLTSDEIQTHADQVCSAILKSIVDYFKPSTFTINLVFVNVARSTCTHRG